MHSNNTNNTYYGDDDYGDEGDEAGPLVIAGFFLLWNSFIWCAFIKLLCKQTCNGEKVGGAQLIPFLFMIPFVGVGIAVPIAVGGPLSLGIAAIPIVISVPCILYRNPENPITSFFLSFCRPCLAKSAGLSELHEAAFDGDLEKCRALVDKGADVSALSKSGATALHSAFFFVGGLDDWGRNVSTSQKFARAKAKFEVAQLLMDKTSALKETRDSFGKTPLDVAPDHFACAKAGLLEPMKMMIALKGADPMQPSGADGFTLMHAAAFCSPGKWSESHKLCSDAVTGKCDIAKYLMSLGLSPHVQRPNGSKPIDQCTVSPSTPYYAQYKNTPNGPGPIYDAMLQTLTAASPATMQAPMSQAAPMGQSMTQQMQVVVPAGISPGQAFTIQAPDGSQMSVACPPGVTAGQTIAVMMPMPVQVVQATAIAVTALPV